MGLILAEAVCHHCQALSFFIAVWLLIPGALGVQCWQHGTGDTKAPVLLAIWVESECLNRFWSVKFGSLVMAMGVSSRSLLSMRWCWPCCSRILRSSLEKMTQDSLAKSNLGRAGDPMTIQWTTNNDQHNQFQDFKLSLDCAPASLVLYGKQGPGQRWAQSFGGLALAAWQADLPGYWPEPRLNKKARLNQCMVLILQVHHPQLT